MTGSTRMHDSKQSNSPFRIFKSPKYCLYFGGQLISQAGTWMQMLAVSWLAYKITHSAFSLALVGTASQLPALIVMPFAGVVADRFNRHRVVLFTQIVAMIQAAILAYLTLTNQIAIEHLILLGIWAGIVAGFDMPARNAFVIGLVDKKEDLAPAIAMNATLFNITRLVGPALAGFIVSTQGEGHCFLINAISYIAVITALLFIKGHFEPPKTNRAGVIKELKEGMVYAWNTSPVRALIILLAVFGLGGMAYAILMPVFVKQIGGNANTLGYLMAASAVGSLVGTLMLARRKQVAGLGKWITRASFGFSVGLVGLSFVHSFWPAICMLMFMGFCFMIQLASANTILQTLVDDDKRGRVMSLFSMAFMGTAPIGSLVCGAISNQIGFNMTILGCGIYCLLIALIWTLLLPKLQSEARPLYLQKGLLFAEEEASMLRS